MVVMYIMDAIRDSARERVGWFYARDIVAASSERAGKLVNAYTIGKYMVVLCENREVERRKERDMVCCEYQYRYMGDGMNMYNEGRMALVKNR